MSSYDSYKNLRYGTKIDEGADKETPPTYAAGTYTLKSIEPVQKFGASDELEQRVAKLTKLIISMKNKGDDGEEKAVKRLTKEEAPRADKNSLQLQADAAFKRARRLQAFVHKDWIATMRDAQQARMAAMVGQRMVKQQLDQMPVLAGASFGMIGRLMAGVVSKVGGGELSKAEQKQAAAMKDLQR